MISNFKQLDISDRIINRYLYYKNLEVNRMYSSSKKKNRKTRSLFMVVSKTKEKKILFIT